MAGIKNEKFNTISSSSPTFTYNGARTSQSGFTGVYYYTGNSLARRPAKLILLPESFQLDLRCQRHQRK